ncbi:MAG TPA: hypothetical protein VFH51_05115, partial [Myxococcota bacterium]|nr:hypothetical protein [Myxococcota bacterium]
MMVDKVGGAAARTSGLTTPSRLSTAQERAPAAPPRPKDTWIASGAGHAATPAMPALEARRAAVRAQGVTV